MEEYNSKEDIQNELKQFGSYLVFLWTYQDLKVLKDSLPLSEIDIDDIVRIRVFDKDKELHIWRNGKSLNGRVRDDSKLKFIPNDQVLLGSVKEKVDELKVADFLIAKQNEKLMIKTHNYYQANDIGQVGYVDSRFVEILNSKDL